MTWTDNSGGVGGATGDTSGFAVKAQVYAADGSRIGSELLVNTATANSQATPQIKALPDGGFVVTWQDTSAGVGGTAGDASGTAIKAQVFSFAAPLAAVEQVDLSLKGYLVATDVDTTGTVTGTITAAYGIVSATAGDSGVGVAGSGTGTLTITGTIAQINAFLGYGNGSTSTLVYNPNTDAPPASTTLSFTLNDGNSTSATAMQTIAITGVNDAPILSGAGHTSAYVGGAAPVAIEPGLTLVDDNATQASATVTISAGFQTGDVLAATTTGTTITASYDAATHILTLTRTDTLAHYQQVLDSVTYASTATDPTAGGAATSRTISFASNDGALSSNGVTSTITVSAPVDQPPVAVADATTTTEAATVTIAVLANDTDPDGGPKAVATVNGVALAAGGTTTLASGAVVTLNADGTLGYDPNHAFDYLNAQSSTVDMFGYTLNGGSAATVSVTVTGVTSGDGTDGNHGSAGNDVIVGSGYIDASQGGVDVVTGSAANDGFFFGAKFVAADRVDGGAGTNDQIGLMGDYTGANALVLQAATITGVEVIAALAGFSYDITTVDANVAAGQTLTIYGSSLGVGNDLTFNGSAETDGGIFRVYGGLGADNITTGSGNDGIYFGAGRFSPATDHVDGGAGTNDQMALDGTYSGLTIARANVVNVETLVLLDGQAVAADYSITLADDWTQGAEVHTVFAVGVRNGISVDAHLETDAALKFYGGRGNDMLQGGADTMSGSNWFDGGAGADTMTGGARVNTFFYGSAANSSGVTHDTIVNFDASMDKIDLPFTIAAIDVAKTGTLSAGSFDTDLATSLATLDTHHAVQFTANNGDLAGHVFEVIDANGVAGYQAGQDYVIELTNTAPGAGFGAVNGPITDTATFV